MTVYVKYQCSICRRIKDEIKDDLRVIPNSCTITKGCEGQLAKIGESLVQEPTNPVAGLTDWYPRGQKQTAVTNSTTALLQSFTTNGDGSMTLFVDSTKVQTVNHLVLTFEQRKIENVAHQQYFYQVGSATTIITGKDSTGKILRFDQTAINDNRVVVLVDGVQRYQGALANEFVLTPNTITFNTAILPGSVVDVSVFQEKTTLTVQLTAFKNSIRPRKSSSWGNISDANFNNVNYTIFTVNPAANIIPGSRLKLLNIKDDADNLVLDTPDLNHAFFGLASTPFESTDRYYATILTAKTLSDDFEVLCEKTFVNELLVDSMLLTDIYPPIEIPYSSYLIEDQYRSSAAIIFDTSLARLQNSIIIGPV